ncbi:MAG: DnaJ domain-containing protein [Methyloceanibacter sp.]|nr:DnaJ domain-containing protein [Methyloceanibacter sp.]
MADDLYSILGVAKGAVAGDITKAYRKLAKKLHPDLNPGDKAAEEKFKQISAAYSILNDAEKRGRYDRGEIDATGQERPQQQYNRDFAGGPEGTRYHSGAGFEDIGEFSDLFGDLFGRGRARRGQRGTGGARFAMRGQDAQYRLGIDFLEAVNGAKKRITLPDGNTLDVTIPAGAVDGLVMRLKGKGMTGVGGAEPGDALVEIAVAPHPVFTREGDDIVVEVPISFDEAVLGGKVEVPTTTGRVAVTVPPGANTGQTLRLKGKGVKTRSGAGDQLVKLSVVLPYRVDDDLKALAEAWRAKHSYDPRRKLKEQA